jgi:hypothetical protein
VSRGDDSPAAANPFDARRLRPGAIPFRWRPGQSAAALLARLEHNGWQGQIVGPHGSGKSALVAAMLEAIRGGGHRARVIELHDGQRRLPADFHQMPDPGEGAVVIVDGYEQLSGRSRFALRRFCRRRKLGLLVTSHTSVGLPDLCRISAGLDVAGEIVRYLLGDESRLVSDDEFAARFHRHEGDLREMLFSLYDLYEQRSRGGR